MKKVLYGLAIGAVVLGAAGLFGYNNRVRSQETVDTAQVPVAAITASHDIIVDAAVIPVREAALSLGTNGIVHAVWVEEGDTVLAGQPLVQLQDERLQASLAQAEANLANAEAQLADLLAPPREAEITKAEANVTSAQASLQTVLDGASHAEIAAKEADLANAQAKLRQAQSNYDEVAWRSDVAMLPQSLELEQATNSYNSAKAALDQLLAGADASDIAGANAGVLSSQSDLALLLAGAEQGTMDAARANVAAQEAAVRNAKAALDEATLRAPFSGTVASVNIEVGEQVTAGMAVVQLADTSQWRIETEDLTELDVVHVAPGDAVEITFDALDDTVLTGWVKHIKPLGENNQGDITYTALIELVGQDQGMERLRWNMSAEATITRDEAGRVALINEIGQAEQPGPVDAIQAPTPLASVESVEIDPLPSTEDTPQSGTVATVGARLNVRSGPSADFEIVEKLENGSQIDILGSNEAGTWLQVVLPGGEPGWVSADFVTGLE